MKLSWSLLARSDLGRIHHFLARYDLDIADAVLDRLVGAPEKLLGFPRRGSKLSEFEPHEVRELRIEGYVMRYGLTQGEIRVLRIFYAREDRFQ